MNDKELPKNELPKPDRDYLDVKKHGEQEQIFPDYPIEKEGKGSKELVQKYNINDKAHSDSSKKDFVKTTSNFKHADAENKDTER